MTRIGATPSSRSGCPKVKRGTPETGSEPTVATIRPSKPAARPFRSDGPASEAITPRPRTPRAKYDIGVNRSARSASGRVNAINTSKPTKPPMTPE